MITLGLGGSHKIVELQSAQDLHQIVGLACDTAPVSFTNQWDEKQ
jgi:hypothetical protein